MTLDDPEAAARWSLKNGTFKVPSLLSECSCPTTPPARLAELFEELVIGQKGPMHRRHGEMIEALLKNPNLPFDTLRRALCGVGQMIDWLYRVEWAWFNPSVPMLAMSQPDLFQSRSDISSMAGQALQRMSRLVSGYGAERFQGYSLEKMVAYWAEYPRHGRITERNAHIRALAERIAVVLSLPWPAR